MDASVYEQFEDRRLHAWEKLDGALPDGIKRGRFLDIGCGIGNGLVAALQHGFQSAVGIDRDFGEFVWWDAGYFDAICRRYDVEAGRAVLVEADLFETKFAAQAFDCVMLLDSIEHVPEPAAFITEAAGYVAPGGVLLLDTSPFYYSRQGHHLFSYFDPETEPWPHLRHDFEEMIQARNVDDWSMQRFHELNRTTHKHVRDAITRTGLEIVTEQQGIAGDETRELFEHHRQAMNLAGINEEWLFEEWVLIVATRA